MQFTTIFHHATVRSYGFKQISEKNLRNQLKIRIFEREY